MDKFINITRIVLFVLALVVCVLSFVDGNTSMGALWGIISLDNLDMYLDGGTIKRLKKKVGELEEKERSK